MAEAVAEVALLPFHNSSGTCLSSRHDKHMVDVHMHRSRDCKCNAVRYVFGLQRFVASVDCGRFFGISLEPNIREIRLDRTGGDVCHSYARTCEVNPQVFADHADECFRCAIYRATFVCFDTCDGAEVYDVPPCCSQKWNHAMCDAQKPRDVRLDHRFEVRKIICIKCCFSQSKTRIVYQHINFFVFDLQQ